MPKLADLLCRSVNNSSDFDSAWYVRFAYNLQMDVSKAQELFSAYGKGHIYARTGFVMPDTPYQRRKMVANFGACVIVTSDGEMWQRTPECIGARNRRKACIADKRTRREICRNERMYREEKRLERLFEDGMTKPSPKRGGRANRLGDIGKYVGVRGGGVADFEPKGVNRLVIIRINV